MKFRVRHIIIGACAWGILSLIGCADEPADGKEQMHTRELRLSLGTHQFDATRAPGDLPDNFEAYDYSTAMVKIQEIQGYMAYWNNDKKPSAEWDALSCIFSTTPGANGIWTSKVALKPLSPDADNLGRETYYLYGFLPKENVNGGVSIAPYGDPESYAKGAVMTFTGLNTVVGNDLCVFVGVQGYTVSDSDPDFVPNMTSRLGKFNYYPETEGNLIYLLVDRFYAGLKFSMTLDAKYAELRDIKVKKVKLTPKDGDNDVIETVNAVVTIKANNANPLSVDFQNPKSGNEPAEATLYNGESIGEAKSLSTNPAFIACVCPGVNTKFSLETTYDVYDKEGNKIRENERVRNAISLRYDLATGVLHTVNILVKPTYLYVLSDPDLDNPTFLVNE